MPEFMFKRVNRRHDPGPPSHGYQIIEEDAIATQKACPACLMPFEVGQKVGHRILGRGIHRKEDGEFFHKLMAIMIHWICSTDWYDNEEDF